MPHFIILEPAQASRRRAPATPTADDILNRYIQILGGAQRLAGPTSFVGKGNYEGFDSYHGKVAVEVYAKSARSKEFFSKLLAKEFDLRLAEPDEIHRCD